MVRKSMLLLLPLAAAGLAGCGEREIQMEAGEWEMEMAVKNVSAPGLPAEVQSQLRTQLETQMEKNRDTNCLTEAEARNPVGRVFSKNARDENCETEDMEWKDGRIRGRMVCREDNGVEMKGDLDGEYSAEDLEMDFDGEITGPDLQGQRINIELEIEGRRLGECRGRDRR